MSRAHICPEDTHGEYQYIVPIMILNISIIAVTAMILSDRKMMPPEIWREILGFNEGGIGDFLEITPATGTAMEPPGSDDATEIMEWDGYRVKIVNPMEKFYEHEEFGIDQDEFEDRLEERFPGIISMIDTVWFYRRFGRGSDDFVHYSLSTYDPGNADEDLLELLIGKNLFVMVDAAEKKDGVLSFPEQIALYISSGEFEEDEDSD